MLAGAACKTAIRARNLTPVDRGAYMAGSRTEEDIKRAAARRAALLVTEAMDVLDAHGVAPEAAAHFAMGQQELRERLRD